MYECIQNVPLLIRIQYHHLVSTPESLSKEKKKSNLIQIYYYTSKFSTQSCQTHHKFPVMRVSGRFSFCFVIQLTISNP